MRDIEGHPKSDVATAGPSELQPEGGPHAVFTPLNTPDRHQPQLLLPLSRLAGAARDDLLPACCREYSKTQLDAYDVSK